MNAPFSATAAQIYDELDAYLLEVNQNPELRQTLINYSLSIAHEPELDPFQHYIAVCYVEDNFDRPVYLSLTEEEKNSSITNPTLLNLESGFLTESQLSELVQKILLKNAETVFIQEVAAVDHAYNLYKDLCKNYTHFIYVPSALKLDPSVKHVTSGILIASKFAGDSLEIFLAGSTKGRDAARKAGGGWEAGIDLKYGGKDGPQLDGYVRGEAHDDKGNYVEGRVDHNFNDNEGNIGVRGGNKDENN